MAEVGGFEELKAVYVFALWLKAGCDANYDHQHADPTGQSITYMHISVVPRRTLEEE